MAAWPSSSAAWSRVATTSAEPTSIAAATQYQGKRPCMSESRPTSGLPMAPKRGWHSRYAWSHSVFMSAIRRDNRY
jgi:hypothetical protein